MDRKVFIEVMGCNRRRLELERIKNYFLVNGYTLVKDPAKAEVILVGTCAFKEKEETESVARLRRLSQYKARTVVYGCLPAISPARYDEFRGIEYITPKDLDRFDLIFNHASVKLTDIEDTNVLNSVKSYNLYHSIKQKLLSKEMLLPEFHKKAVMTGLKSIQRRFAKEATHYYLYVARGCLGKCSYCAIRRSIGSVRSKPVETVLRELRAGLAGSYRDFVILGDDPGCYGLDQGQSFPELMSALYETADSLHNGQGQNGNGHVRFHIWEIHPKYLILYAQQLKPILSSQSLKSILCPVQTMNDRLLQSMQREHTAREISEVVMATKRNNAGLELHTQIMVGFPGETEDEYKETLDEVSRLGFNSVVVFKYHDKEGTAASRLERKISDPIKEYRLKHAVTFLKHKGIRAYTSCPD